MPNSLEVMSLGGSGGFGMNSTLVACAGRAILIDYGIGFPHSGLPGVEKLVPDPSAVVARFPKLDAIALTHGHDDHVGALPWLPAAWRGARLVGSPLALAAARDRFGDAGEIPPEMTPADSGMRFELGPFVVEFVHVTHSTPQSKALIVQTPAGVLVHSGDFRLDPNPVLDGPTDLERLARVSAGDGVRLLLLDSTGALRGGRTGSESDVAEGLREAVVSARGQVFVSTFSSHLHRIQSVIAAARATGRRVACLGRRLGQMLRHGADLGLIDVPAGTVLEPSDLSRLPRARRLWLAGGCQGELGSSLARLSFEADSRAQLHRGDTVLLSASVIPGNQLLVARMIDRFLRLGAGVITPREDERLHISGHGNRDEIAELVDLLRPRAVVPVHGDRRNLEAVAELVSPAVSEPVPVAERGESLMVEPDSIRRGPVYELGETLIDSRGRELSIDLVSSRRRMAESGVVWVELGPLPPLPARVRVQAVAVADWEGPDGLGRRLPRAVREELAAALAERVPPGRLLERVRRRAAAILRAGGRRRPELLITVEGVGAVGEELAP
jgi:ribonuclease J